VIAAFVSTAESWSNVAANAAQAAAILVGGWWAYTRFIRQREGFPRASLEQSVTHRKLSGEHTYLSVALGVQNTSTVLMRNKSVRTDVHQVLPVHPDVERSLADGTLIPDDEPHALWHCLDSKKVSLQGKIEPGDRDHFDFDFVIPAAVKTVYVYSYVDNATADNLGWGQTCLYDL
jgi:hypothetical protein